MFSQSKWLFILISSLAFSCYAQENSSSEIVMQTQEGKFFKPNDKLNVHHFTPYEIPQTSSLWSPGFNGVTIELSFLYWQAANHGYVFAFDHQPPSSSIVGQDYHHFQGCEVKYHLHPGFRIGLGYTTPWDQWNIEALYTYFYGSNHRNVKAKQFDPSDGLGLTPSQAFGSFPALPIYFANARGSWALQYHTGDLEIKKNYEIRKTLSLIPILGVRGASLNQIFRYQFNLPLDHETDTLKKYDGHSLYWGIGPRFGLNALWHLPCQVGFSGLLTTSLLYGKEKVINNSFRSFDAHEWIQVGFQKQDFTRLVPSLQLALGFNWSSCFNQDKVYVLVDLSWEMNYWWDQLYSNVGTFRTKAVEIQGLTLKTQVNF
jgi:hypothetical protein